MTTIDEEAGAKDIDFATAALPHYGLAAKATVRLISLSENATFLVESEQPLGILRVYRPSYQTDASMRSELLWIDALRQAATVRTPAIIPTSGGELLATVEVRGESRGCALFEYVPGDNLGDEDLETFSQVGRTAARLHRQVADWQLPDGFERFTWDVPNILDAGARWGDWREGPGLTAEGKDLLERVEAKIRAAMANYPWTRSTAGLVHGDLRAANIMVDPAGELWVIDFDDCGFSWLLWDLCSTTTFIEHLPQVDDIVKAWLDGYLDVQSLADTDLAIIPDLVLLRRLHILAWLGTHKESDLSKDLGDDYATATCALAQRYLDDEFLVGVEAIASARASTGRP